MTAESKKQSSSGKDALADALADVRKQARSNSTGKGGGTSASRALADLEKQVLEAFMDGKSYQEIAVMLDRHVKSIDNALQRVKRKLMHFRDEKRNDE